MLPITTSPVIASGLKFGFDHSSAAGLIIGGLLIVLSLACWSQIASKLIMVSRSRKANAAFLRAFRHSPHPLAVFQERDHHAESPVYHIYNAGSRELAFHLVGTDEADETFASRLQSAARITPSQMKAVGTALERAAAEAGTRLEEKMAGLASVMRAAPLLGLMGTVWALIDGFGHAAAGTDPAAYSVPAILCSSLLPLLIGLLVAVPGLLGHQWVASKIRALEIRGEHFISEFTSVLQRHFVDHRISTEGLPSIRSLGSPTMPAFGTPRVETPSAAPKVPGA